MVAWTWSEISCLVGGRILRGVFGVCWLQKERGQYEAGMVDGW